MKFILTALFVLAAYIAPAAAAEPLFLDKASIDKDTTWSGTVILRGQNVVKKGATLTIMPGTVIKFVWIDEDGDNIGDGELNVEGRIIARGTKDNVITFTSAQPEPKMKDWTYIILSHAGESVVEYCRIMYAFTAVQVHWSRATIKDNVITDNFEGIRFSTAVVDLLHNTISGNAFGVRYETRGSAANISENEITGNGCGFFAVVKCAGGAVIRDNNIQNVEYNVKLGDQQKEGLDFRGNWWGTAEPGAIESGIMDGRVDSGLGRVAYDPFLLVPAAGAGVE